VQISGKNSNRVKQSTVVDAASEALAIAASALRYENLTDLPQILRQVGEATGSFAVLLWELAPDVNPQDKSHLGQLFVLADWLRSGDHFTSHTLPLRSLTGTAVLDEATQVCQDVNKDARVHRDPSDFFERHGIRSFVSIPLRFGDSERGALNLYQVDKLPISDAGLATAEAFAKVLPGIWSGLREKSSLKMIGALNGIIQKYEGRSDRLQLSTRHHGRNQALAAELHRGNIDRHPQIAWPFLGLGARLSDRPLADYNNETCVSASGMNSSGCTLPRVG
jgi:hypothetical protein